MRTKTNPYPKNSNMARFFDFWANASADYRNEFIAGCESASPASMHGTINAEYRAAVAARKAA